MGLRSGSITGSITFGGIGSGFPTNEIIDQILELEQRPIDLLEGQKTDFEEKLGILQDLNTKTLFLRNALRDLDNMTNVRSSTSPSAKDEFSRFKATSSDSTIGTAATTSSASPGGVTIRVDRLAQRERDVSQASAYTNLTDTVGTGNFRIKVGTDSDVDITIDSSNNTLEGFISAINDSDAHVRAFLINDGSGSPYRIAIEAIDANEALDLATGTTLTGGTATPSFVASQSAQDAQIVLDPDGGLPITMNSNSNTFVDVIRGLTFEAKQASASSITIQVEEDVDAMVEAISGLVTAYNDIIGLIDEQATVDPATNRGGPLIGDSTLLSLQRRLSTVITSQIGSGSIKSATQLGIELDSKGKLSLDEDKLRAQLSSSFDAVKSFFSGTSSFSAQLRVVADDFVDIVDGSLVTRIQGATRSISDLESSIRAAEDRLVTIESNLVQQFSSLERIISDLQLQGNFLNQFLLASLR